MVIHRHSRSGIFKKLFTLTLISGIGILLICASAGAADCTSCHAGKQVPAPKGYGKGSAFKAMEPAPGRYVKAKA